MIEWDDFENTVSSVLNKDISQEGNRLQYEAIRASPNESLFLVAGPGSGKTTVIALRILKLVFVDDVSPSSILATTFTRKAAAELRSRILGWGDQLRQSFLLDPSYFQVRNRLEHLNNIRTGTLDSIAEEILGDFRAPGTPPPVIIEDFASNILMTQYGLFGHGRHNNQNLEDYLAQLKGDRYNLGVSTKSSIIRTIKDRFLHDAINETEYSENHTHPGVPVLCYAIRDYFEELERRLLFDFARLEYEFFNRLDSGELNDFVQEIRFVFVDEYQDTNFLQEQIYFELTRAALQNNGSLTVVGDDDQSLYRFRGATVNLFKDYLTRVNTELNINSRTIFLIRNYRSTENIINFYNEFIELDAQFQNVRVTNKPRITPARTGTFHNYPVLGMFREDVDILARDLSQFIYDIVYGGGRAINHEGQTYLIRTNPQEGSAVDAALLCSSPRELGSGGNPRLPLLLRQRLSNFNPPIQVFNPRGQDLQSITDVQILCGLILECIDPKSTVQNGIQTLPHEARDMFISWRRHARSFISSNPIPQSPVSLQKFVNAWQNRSPLGRRNWDREVSLISLIYNLITWIPSMQNDVEGLVYLEAITRTINQAALFSNFSSDIIFDQSNPGLEEASIRRIFWNVLVPIAMGAIEVDEDLLETLPRDRLSIMSIHQAKGLEFPLVIVDVGSDFNRNHWRQAFKRFPRDGGMTCRMEDELRHYSPLGNPTRSNRDRAFDDLFRHYYVAYSRPQDVLLLVGLESGRETIRNVATGWDRAGNWHWRRLSNIVHM